MTFPRYSRYSMDFDWSSALDDLVRDAVGSMPVPLATASLVRANGLDRALVLNDVEIPAAVPRLSVVTNPTRDPFTFDFGFDSDLDLRGPRITVPDRYLVAVIVTRIASHP
jgi:hypothetical protein